MPIEPSPILANRRPNSILNSTTTAAATATATATTTTTTGSSGGGNTNNIGASIKKENRISLHSSKEDLLSNSSSSSNLDIISKDKDAPLLPPKPVREFCRVLYPYEPLNEDELELNVGEIITVLTKELPDKGWWRGELKGKIGVFPDNFVLLLPPEGEFFINKYSF